MDLAQPPLPRRWPDTEFFWSSGADGKLRFLQCQTCGRYAHPPAPICRYCRGRTLEPTVVSGDATVYTFSVVHQPFIDYLEIPYVLAIVEIPEDPGVRLTTRIVGCDPADVHIGMPVRVTFEQHDWVYLPVFTPASP